MNGEDGIIETALELIGKNAELNQWCVEFGAWDGKHLSNTYNLIQNKAYSSVQIEGMQDKYIELQNTFKNNEKVHTHLGYVGMSKENSLDHLLSAYPIPEDFDFLSIDIDGNDYYTWKPVVKYRPKLVCIEFNPTVPNEVDFLQACDPSINQGASILSLNLLAKEKGYELIATTLNNAFFVDEKYFPLFEINDNSLDKIRTDKSRVTYIFSGYDGTVYIRGFGKLDLHNLKFEEKRFQLLPSFLRGYSDTETEKKSPFKKLLKKTYKSLHKRNII